MGTMSDATRSASAANWGPAADTTRKLLDGLFRHVESRDFAVRLWDDQLIPAEKDLAPRFTLVLTHPGALRRMFWPPGELTLAEAYLRGDFDIEGDIVASMELGQSFQALTPGEWLPLLWQVRKLPNTRAPELHELGRQPLQLSGRQHSRERDQAAVTYHYDTGNDFYRLFLGRWMAYSCAYFATRDTDLDIAQAAKFEYICRKLRLQPGERLLDIGCGWGGLVVYAAEHYDVEVVGITLSQPQVEYAQEWIKKAGLGGRAVVESRDYRDIDATFRFDKIVSVGMAEHVGRDQLVDYFRAAYRALRPGGLFLNHAIATHRSRPSSWLERTFLQSGQFMQRYVFPDGELELINETLAAAEESGFEVRDVESLREHYGLTLRNWIRNLESRQAEAVALKDERTYRTWRLYMAASVVGFESEGTNVYQALLSKSSNGDSGLPLTRVDLYTK